MPKSDSVAEMFMSQGRGGSVEASAPVEPCCVTEMKTTLGFDPAGSSKNAVIPDGVCYSPYSENMRAPDWYKAPILAEAYDGDADDAKKS